MSCARCAFYLDYGTMGECRRHAPQADMAEKHHQAVWPTLAGGWCGDFQWGSLDGMYAGSRALPVGADRPDSKTPATEPQPENSAAQPR